MAPRGERLGRVSPRSAGLRGGHSGPSGPACHRSRSGPDFARISLDFRLPGLRPRTFDSCDFGSVSASSISACFGFWLGSGSGLDLPLSLCFPKDFHTFLASRRHSELSREVLGPP